MNCQFCGKTLEIKKYPKKFCNHTCAASFTNRARTSKKDNDICQYCAKSLRGLTGVRFCSKLCSDNRKTIEAFQNNKSPTATTIRKYILLTRENKCVICKLTIWNNKTIPLDVDHIDGNYQNNVEENLRLLCKNCHAQTPNFGNKNKGNGRHYRRQRYKEGKSS